MSIIYSTYEAVIAAPIGKLGLSISGDALLRLDFLASEAPESLPSSPIVRAAFIQLQAYFSDPKAMFTLPLLPRGTPFQRRVWRALHAIPVGSTLTFGMLASQLGTSARAIGGA